MSSGLARWVKNAADVTLLEGVEEIIYEYQRADMLLAPIRVGGGTKYKILEAMAASVPVVTTPVGAQGLDVAHGRELMIADSAAGFIESVAKVIEDDAFRASLQGAARKKIETDYSWDTIAARLEKVWEDARG